MKDDVWWRLMFCVLIIAITILSYRVGQVNETLKHSNNTCTQQEEKK